MAELATGMMIICLPTLPGLLRKRRKGQQSRSLFDTAQSVRYANSERYYELDRSRLSDNDKQISRLEHVESSDTDSPIVNEIQGGYAMPEFSWNYGNEQAAGKILKTVTVEQRRA